MMSFDFGIVFYISGWGISGVDDWWGDVLRDLRIEDRWETKTCVRKIDI